MNNPLDYVTQKDIESLGLTPKDLIDSYQPSGGGVYHARGAESQGKTLWGAHFYRYNIDKGFYTPEDAVGNLTFKGKYGIGYQVLKGDDLRQYLWDMTHKPYQGKLVFIDEIDSEFPARMFTDKDQMEISLRLWHIAKLHNTVIMTSHLGNSTDLIIHLASHYCIYPFGVNFKTNSLRYDIVNNLDRLILRDRIAYDVIKTMLIYNRRELTENTEYEQNKTRPSQLKKQKKEKPVNIGDGDIDFDAEWDILKEAEI